MYRFDTNGQMTMLGLDTAERGGAPPKHRPGKSDSELVSIPYFHLDLLSSPVDLFGQRHWELRSPWREGKRPLNTGAAPRRPIRVSLSGILEAYPSLKYYLSKTACLGILRRAFERGKKLPKMLARALKIQAGLMRPDGQLTNMQMQTFVTQPNGAGEGFDGYSGVMAFAANQRDEVRDLHDVAGALQAQPGMKQQTFVAGLVTKGNGDCFLTPEKHAALLTGGGQAGQGYPCIFVAGFSAGAGASAGTIGYQEDVAPTLKGSPSGNCMPSILCINDQGGQIMECSENITGTLRAQEHGHQPLVLRPGKPLLYENYGIDSRYTGPHKIAPTLSARMGTGGLNTSIVQQVPEEVICIAGNAIDRQPQNGGNGFGWQRDISYTLTTSDRHSVYARQRVDQFRDDEIASTESARQHKDATDLICQPPSTWDADCRNLIRRLTPLECERLQGYPDGWTDVPGASDSARYKALGNSVYWDKAIMLMMGTKMA